MATKEKMVDLKAKAEKITEEELKKLQDIVGNINTLQSEVGKLEVQKHNYLHRLAGVRDEATLMQEELEKVYGTANVNINDGTIEYPKDGESRD
tara:strand:+ start:267 stop:548 length:282 start_codon:yes stop_codon:yes gene_type:complete